MSFRPSSGVWLALGAALAVSGGFTIVISLPGGGQTLWIGVAMVALGSLALRMGLDSGNRIKKEPLAKGWQAARLAAESSTIEPELLKPLPRKVQMTSRGKAMVSIWMLTLAVFAAIAHRHFGLLPPPETKSQLESEGVASVGEVHSREPRSASRGRTLYFVGYSFPTESGAPVRINRTVPLRLYERLREGDTTKVVYFPGNPELHFLPDLTSPVSTRFVLIVAGLLLAVAGMVEAQRRLHRRLVAYGAAVSGFTAYVRRRGGVRSFRVNYDAGGVRRSLKATERNPDLRNGQAATVLYDPKDTTRAVVYRLALYRARAKRPLV